MYLQMLLICLGVAMSLMNWWIVILIPVGGWVLQRLAIVPEEAYLERKFGAPYREYQGRVRRWL
jgi:protein-S-isoprenylcysteine O-methyltransferase Ste14